LSALNFDAIEKRMDEAMKSGHHYPCICVAHESAARIIDLDVPALIAHVRELGAREARVRAVHRPFAIYDHCGHDHNPEDAGVIDVDSVGLVCGYGKVYDICASCCSDDGESQSEHCLVHDHGLGHPICATIAALDEVSA